jgi:uncharacterized protein YndB with AHSA1/START domain
MSDSTLTKDAVVVERIFDAPVDIIWQMWTEPEHFRNWYGPKGLIIPIVEMDLRVGGQRLCCMETQTPDGTMEFWTYGEYLEIVPNERLVYTDIPSNEKPDLGNGEDNNSFTTVVTVLLENLGEQTKVVITHTGFPADVKGARQGAKGGWTQSLEKMANYVETVRQRQ